MTLNTIVVKQLIFIMVELFTTSQCINQSTETHLVTEI
jgi:hypothetical protein